MLRLDNVSKYYYGNDVVALGLRKVSLEFKLGEFVAVSGESGSGKSTLLNVISGLDTYEDGELYINGEETSYYTKEEWESYRRQYIGFVFQNYNIIDSYSVLENVMVALTLQGYDKATRKERALELIDKVGLSTHIHHKASKLSGGQKQRAVIARALAKDCPIIVADEPTGNLDSETGNQIMKLLQEISQDKLVIVVTHNYDQVADYATRKIRLFDGEVVEDKKLKDRQDVKEGITLAKYRISFAALMAIAARNLFRTPRRTIFTIVVAMFISLAFMFSFGSYVEGTTTGYQYGGGIYSNVHERRIIVTKFDNTPFTSDDMSALRALDDVLYVLDIDLILDSTLQQAVNEYGYLSYQDFFVNPAGMLTLNDLKEGRLPENEFEVVVEDIEGFEIGQTIDVSMYFGRDFRDDRSYTEGQIPLEIVGIVENGVNPNTWEGYMFFHEDFLHRSDILINAYFSYLWSRQATETTFSIDDGTERLDLNFWGNIIIDNTVPDDEVLLGYSILNELATSILQVEDAYENNPDFYQSLDLVITGTTNFYEKELVLDIAGEQNPTTIEDEKIWNSNIAVNETTLAKLLPDAYYQLGVMIPGTFQSEDVINDIEALGYNAIYPASVGTQIDEFYGIFQTILFGFLMFALMIVVYWVTYAVLRNVQTAKKKDYLIFRSIGASKKDLYRVTNIEMVYVFLSALIIVLAFFAYNQINQVWVIPQYLEYFSVGTYVVLFLILFTIAIFLGRRFNKRIFGRSVITALRQE
jgi:ABC-type lipoprotein export system ATPase subunit